MCLLDHLYHFFIGSSNRQQVFFTERCLDTDYHVFTKMLRDESSIDRLELELYERLLTQLKATATPLSAIIYVNTNPGKQKNP